MDFKVVLKVFIEGSPVGRDMTFNTQDEVVKITDQIKMEHADQVEASADYCLHIPDPKLHPDSQWLEGKVPLSVASTLKTGDRVELRRVPLKLSVFFAVENKNLVRALRKAKAQVHLEPNMEMVLAIGRLKRLLGDALPPDEYCLALVNRDEDTRGPEQRFSANWINGNSTPEFYGVGPDAELLLWPLRLFMRKTAEDLKNPTCAGQLRYTKKDNPSKAEKRHAVIKFNLFFVYTAARGKTPEVLANLEHYYVTQVEREGKKRWKFRLEKVMESFTPTPAVHWLVFDDEQSARQWNAALATECANRQGGTKLPPPRVNIPDKVPKSLFPKDPVVLPEPPHDPPALDLDDIGLPAPGAQVVAQRAVSGAAGGSNNGPSAADAAARTASPPNVLPLRDSGLYSPGSIASAGSDSPGGSADMMPPLGSAVGAPPPPGAAAGAPPPNAPAPPLAADVGAPPPPMASDVGAPPPPLAANVGAPPPPAAVPANLPPPSNLPPPTNLPPPPGSTPAPAAVAPPPAEPTGPPIIDRCKALYDYDAPDAENEHGERAISFKAGVLLEIYEKRPTGWAHGKNPDTGNVGLLPANFLQNC